MNIREELLRHQINIAKEAAETLAKAKDQWIVDNVLELVGQDEGRIFVQLVDTLRENPESKSANAGVRSFLRRHGIDIVLTVTRTGADGWGHLDQYSIIRNRQVVRSITWKSDF